MHKQLTGLYAITDANQTDHAQLIFDVKQALLGGARIIQYRDKSTDHAQRLISARQLRQLTDEHGAIFIINDDVQLAQTVQADGVHLGKDDARIEAAREILGTEAIIGVSCYNRFDLAQQSAKAGADYVAFGRFFPSGTKPDATPADIELLHRAKNNLSSPIVAIGGITGENADILINAGADMVAVMGGLFDQADIEKSARQLQQLFESQPAQSRLRE